MTDNKKEIFSLLGGRKAARAETERHPADTTPQPTPEPPVAPEMPVTPKAETPEPLVTPELGAPEPLVTPELGAPEAIGSEQSVSETSMAGATPPRFADSATPVDREIRATFILKETYSDALRDLAWYDRKKIKDVLNEALEAYILKNNNKLGAIRKMKAD